jgi:hypothetical protein
MSSRKFEGRLCFAIPRHADGPTERNEQCCKFEAQTVFPLDLCFSWTFRSAQW